MSAEAKQCRALRFTFVVGCLCFLSGCASNFKLDFSKTLRKHVDCDINENNACVKPRFNVLSSDRHKLSARISLGKTYMLQYKYKF